jgi:hypothetical protein
LNPLRFARSIYRFLIVFFPLIGPYFAYFALELKKEKEKDDIFKNGEQSLSSYDYSRGSDIPQGHSSPKSRNFRLTNSTRAIAASTSFSATARSPRRDATNAERAPEVVEGSAKLTSASRGVGATRLRPVEGPATATNDVSRSSNAESREDAPEEDATRALPFADLRDFFGSPKTFSPPK